MENSLSVEKRFRFPRFIDIMWLTALYYLNYNSASLSEAELASLAVLGDFLLECGGRKNVGGVDVCLKQFQQRFGSSSQKRRKLLWRSIENTLRWKISQVSCRSQSTLSRRDVLYIGLGNLKEAHYLIVCLDQIANKVKLSNIEFAWSLRKASRFTDLKYCYTEMGLYRSCRLRFSRFGYFQLYVWDSTSLFGDSKEVQPDNRSLR